MMERSRRQVSLQRQCVLLGLSRSSWYFQPYAREDNENLALIRALDEEFTKHPFFGQPSDVPHAAAQRLDPQPQAGAEVDAQDGLGFGGSLARNQQARAGAQD